MSTITCLVLLLAVASVAATPKTALNRDDFRDKVYACWLGKNIGGTLGAPFEGNRDTHALTFYQPVPDKPTANDDLDLQLLWLKALEERGPGITCRDLGEYWLKFVPVDWNEYGIGKKNMRDGFPPPISGQFRNVWKDSNGAWIRSEIWACVAPGCPALAAKYAWEDACVDHGAAEGTYAELFTASLESAAFVDSDRDKLIEIGLSYIPKDCAVAKSIHAATDAHARGLDWKAAREAVVEASKSTGWFMAPQNVAFVVLGWLYGEGDFGKSLCAAVNCGDDTDCTGATLGSLLGILHGTKGIPEAWRKPVGETILNVAIAGFQPPKTIRELTDRTVEMAPKVLAANSSPVAIQAKSKTKIAKDLKLVDAEAAKSLWSRSPWVIRGHSKSLELELDFGGEPLFRLNGGPAVTLFIKNTSSAIRGFSVRWAVGDGLVPVSPTERSDLGTTCQIATRLNLTPHGPEIRTGTVAVTLLGEPPCAVPFAIALDEKADETDIALASKGATATSDSELDREPGCTAKVIDGEASLADQFDGHRWHSALTPHPHGVVIHLPEESSIRSAVVHFADPAGHPVDFRCETSLDGVKWTTVGEEHAYADSRRYTGIYYPAIKLRHFRFTILKSSSEKWPDAAQLSEIELIP